MKCFLNSNHVPGILQAVEPQGVTPLSSVLLSCLSIKPSIPQAFLYVRLYPLLDAAFQEAVFMCVFVCVSVYHIMHSVQDRIGII